MLPATLSGRPAEWLAEQRVAPDLSSPSPERFAERLENGKGDGSAIRRVGPN